MSLLPLDHYQAPVEIDESAYMLADPFVGALNVAAAKARAARQAGDDVVLAADTLVVAAGGVLGKPRDAEMASRMLHQLRGATHTVLTGVALRGAGEREWGGIVSTRVVMRDYSDTDIDGYVARGEPFDKAGGYAVQDTLFRPVERLEGCYLNVVGLPLCAVAAGLAALGIKIPAPTVLKPPCEYCRRGAAMVS